MPSGPETGPTAGLRDADGDGYRNDFGCWRLRIALWAADLCEHAHITGGHVESDAREAGSVRSYQPMNVNFGLFPPLLRALDKDEDGKRLRGPEKALATKRALSRRALDDLTQWAAGAQHSVAAE